MEFGIGIGYTGCQLFGYSRHWNWKLTSIPSPHSANYSHPLLNTEPFRSVLGRIVLPRIDLSLPLIPPSGVKLQWPAFVSPTAMALSARRPSTVEPDSTPLHPQVERRRRSPPFPNSAPPPPSPNLTARAPFFPIVGDQVRAARHRWHARGVLGKPGQRRARPSPARRHNSVFSSSPPPSSRTRRPSPACFLPPRRAPRPSAGEARGASLHPSAGEPRRPPFPPSAASPAPPLPCLTASSAPLPRLPPWEALYAPLPYLPPRRAPRSSPASFRSEFRAPLPTRSGRRAGAAPRMKMARPPESDATVWTSIQELVFAGFFDSILQFHLHSNSRFDIGT